MWLPIYNDVNSHSIPLSLSYVDSSEDTLKIIPQPNFNFILNSKTDHNNARLFEVQIFLAPTEAQGEQDRAERALRVT